jgi:thiol-disulfide isomerase/thioredoxin
MLGGVLLNATATSDGVLAQLIDPTPIPEPTWRTPPTPPPREGCVNPAKVPTDRPLRLSMHVLDGPDFHLEQLQGNAVWLNFFATWCGPCHREMPDIVKLANRRFADGLRVIGINVDEDDDKVRGFRKKYNIQYPIAMDKKGVVFDALRLQYYPTSMFFKPDGHLACIRRGSLSADEMGLELTKTGLALDLPSVAAPAATQS